MSEKKPFRGGYNFRGIEASFEKMIRQAIDQRTTAIFRTLEIGIAEGTTLISTAELCREVMGSEGWQCCGLDLLDGPYFNPTNFLKRTLAFNTHIEFEGRCNREPFIADRVTADIRVLLLKGDEKRAMVSPGSVNFCLIDGCHGAPCVEKDFLSIEAGMAKGGIVAFHDAGDEDQGISHQPHCGMPISVHQALFNLGLCIPNLLHGVREGEVSGHCIRPGWKYLGHVDGDKSPGNPVDNGHGIVFFEKV